MWQHIIKGAKSVNNGNGGITFRNRISCRKTDSAPPGTPEDGRHHSKQRRLSKINCRAQQLLSVLSAALLCISISLGLAATAPDKALAEEQDFVVRPYVQLGDHPTYSTTDNEVVLWISTHHQAKWSVECRDAEKGEKGEWQDCGKVSSKCIRCSPEARDFLFETQLKNLSPGKRFSYRVQRDGKTVFEANSLARKAANEDYTFAVFGDCGAGTPGQKQVAWHCFNAKPDFLVIPGDIVYNFGLYKEYLQKFFPIINAETASPSGVPLLSQILTFAIIGNHDIALTKGADRTDLSKFPDALAYFYLWSEPLNGPKNMENGNTPIGGTKDEEKNFKELAGPNFPVMANYSFDYANSHWLVLDGNYYTKWTDPKWRQWVEQDLEKAKSATWRFVAFHQPGFSADNQHLYEQRMRLLSDIFQKENVDLVFAGHAHDYQRTFPLEFSPKQENGMPLLNENGTVDGDIALDKTYDGVKKTKPKGIIYIVSGAGGAKLYGEFPGQETAPQKSFIDKFDGNQYSFSLCSIKGKTFTLKQINGEGKTIDQFIVKKNHQAP
jgi:3',5'-cyclic AMP phosphodiesterase CpdA